MFFLVLVSTYVVSGLNVVNIDDVISFLLSCADRLENGTKVGSGLYD